MRITTKFLEAQIDRINKITNNPATPWTRENNRSRSNIGNYHLGSAYGGVCLHQMCNESGGVRDVFGCGHITKRELSERMYAYICGLNDALDK